MYVSMLRCRMLTERAQYLLSGSAPTTDWDFAIGHEAIVVGGTLELGPEDTVVASLRNIPAQIARGSLAGICGIADGASEPNPRQSSRTELVGECGVC